MGYDIGDFVIGKITQIRPYALFLSFEDGSSGLLHISEISDSYVRDIEKIGTIGDSLKVKVIEKDPYNGFLRLSYKQVPESERYSSHVSNERRIPEQDELGFSSLANKLPEWIENTLEKARKKDD